MDKLIAVSSCVNQMVEMYITDFRTNLQFDLEKGISDNHSSKDGSGGIFRVLSTKVLEIYGWLKLLALIYDVNFCGSDKHTFDGSYVIKLHYFKKCGINNWNKNKPIESHHRAQEVLKVSKKTSDSVANAHNTYEKMKAFMDSSKITWSGLACIKRYVDLQGYRYYNLI